MIAMDMDGTLLDADGAVTPRTSAALADAADAGWHLVIATGRPPQLVTSFGDALAGVRHVVATNGALITTFLDGTGLHQLHFDLGDARAIVAGPAAAP